MQVKIPDGARQTINMQALSTTIAKLVANSNRRKQKTTQHNQQLNGVDSNYPLIRTDSIKQQINSVGSLTSQTTLQRRLDETTTRQHGLTNNTRNNSTAQTQLNKNSTVQTHKQIKPQSSATHPPSLPLNHSFPLFWAAASKPKG